MPKDRPNDHIDTIVSQWATERPDVETRGMRLIGRIARLEHRIRPELADVFAQHGLQAWEFDVLATLRRHGAPFQLSAGDLMSSMMISSGSMTNRIDRLVARGFVERRADHEDGRIVLVALTASGRTTIDSAVVDHVANQNRLVGGLDADERRTLEQLLRTFEATLDDIAPP